MIESESPRLTFGRFLEDTARRHAGRRAIFFEGREIFYEDLHAEARELARALMGAGVVKGARVAVLMSNRPEFIVSAYAIGMVGGVLVPINTFANSEELAFILRHSDASLLLMQPGLLKHRYLDDLLETHPEVGDGTPGRLRVSALPQLRRVVALGIDVARGGVETWASLLEQADDVSDALLDAACAEVEPSDDAVTIYTSGTTAHPKGVLHSQRAGVLQGYRFADLLRYGSDDRIYTAYPFFWGAGLAMSIGGTFAAGACLLIEETFEPGAALDVIESQRATALHAWVHQQNALAEHPSAAGRDLSTLRMVEGTGPLAKLVGMEKDEYGFGSSYGLSETFTLTSMLAADAPAQIRHAAHGKPLPDMRIRIVDPESGDPLKTGESGEIAVKGVTFMKGYYKVLPEKYLDANGFFRTQDAGSIDDEGYLHWTGRMSNMIKTGGANVSPIEIERALESCPGVQNGVAVGIPHPKLGEVIVLGVTPTTGSTLDPVAVRTFLRGKLSAYKVPKHVFVYSNDDLSFTANQKVQVAPLRKLVTERLVREGVEIDGHRYCD